MSYSIIVPDSVETPTSFPTASEYAAALADQLGSRLSSVISSTVVSGEPGRWVLIDDLRDDEYERAKFAGGWVYLVNGTMAGLSRRVRDTGFEGPFGALGLARVLESDGTPTDPTADTLVQVTHPLPWTQVGSTRGLLQFCNEGLARVWTRARIQIYGDGTQRYSLSAYPHITSEDWIDGIYDWSGQATTTLASTLTDDAPSVVVSGATVTLETQYTYTQDIPFQVAAFVPGNRLIYTGNSWAYTTAGLVNQTDQAAIPISTMLPFAMSKALQYLYRLTMQDRSIPKDEKTERLSEIMNRRRTWALSARGILKDVLPKPMAKASRGLTGGVAVANAVTKPGWGNLTWP